MIPALKERWPSDNVSQFADVPWPVVIHEQLRSPVRKRARWFAVFLEELAQEKLDEQRDILFALAQRGQTQRDNVQPVKQVFAEAAFANEFHQIFVGCCENADVNLNRLGAAEPHKLALLNDAQEFHLCFRTNGRNFVEENRAPVGEFKQALL